MLRSDPSTLFRAFTPFSKLLETTMRLVTRDLLQTALSPTIASVATRKVTLKYLEAEDGSHVLREESVEAVLSLASSCLKDLYCLSELSWLPGD